MALKYTDAALDDVADRAEYLGRESLAAAERWLARLETSIARLERFPEASPVSRDPRLARHGYRVLVVDDVLVFYTLSGADVVVRRVLHGRRRYGPLL